MIDKAIIVLGALISL
ncbi:damage-inducible type I toxin DinQ, partial [Escherichia coli]